MSRKLYLGLFMVLCVTFVPVPFFYGFGGETVPVGYMATDLFGRPWDNMAVVCLTLAYLLIYSLVFFVVALISFWLTNKPLFQANRIALQILFLALVFSFSFIPAITYGGMGGGGGTYTFWGAVHRYFEKYYPLYHSR